MLISVVFFHIAVRQSDVDNLTQVCAAVDLTVAKYAH
jgi:hypothetical protein